MNDQASDKTPARLQLAFGVACALLVVLGGVALYVRFSEGLRATNLGSLVGWGLWVGFYIYFIGLSAGSFLLSTLVYVFNLKKFEPIGPLAVFQALVCLVIGLFFIFLDLGHPGRFWHTLAYPQWSSVLAWEIWFYNAYIVILVAELWLLMRCDLADLAQRTTGLRRLFYRAASLGFACPESVGRRAVCHAQSMRWLKFFGIIGIPCALGVHGGTGAIFAVVAARPYWYSPLFPVVFIVSALVSGGALLMCLKATRVRHVPDEVALIASLGKLTAGFLIADLTLLFLEFLVGLYGQIPEHVAAYRLIAFGPFWWVFWIVQLALGAAVPLVLIFWRRTNRSLTWLAAAGFLIVVGIFGVRLNIVIPPLSIPPFHGYTEAYVSARLTTWYFPNWVEWLSSIGAVAAGALVFIVGPKLLPLVGNEAPWARATKI